MIAVFDVVKEGAGGAPVINITPLFTTNSPPGFALDFKRHYRMAQVDGQRSLIRNVRAFPKNVAIGFYQTWIPEEKELLKPPKDEDPPPAALGSTSRPIFCCCRKSRCCPAARTSAWAISRCPSAITVPVSTAWSTEPSLPVIAWKRRIPRAAVSEPVTPIVFYLSPEVPKVAPLSQASGGAVARSSRTDRVQERHLRPDAPTKEEDPDWDPGDLRYSVIRWAPGPRESAGTNVIDPRSGEVISSHTLVWHDVLRLAELWYFTQVAPLDPRAANFRRTRGRIAALRGIARDRARPGAAPQPQGPLCLLGATAAQPRVHPEVRQLSLNHRLLGFNYVGQPGDNAYLLPIIGEYNYFAIDWGYREIPGSKSCATGGRS